MERKAIKACCKDDMSVAREKVTAQARPHLSGECAAQ
jgi:hypothetical protein